MTNPTSFPAVLARALRTDPGRPFLTFYDESTGERVELSLTTYANWVAKAGSLLDEVGLEKGATLGIDLPPHWLGFVFAGAALTTGVALTDGPADAIVTGPEGLTSWARQDGVTVLACSLLPLGVRFREDLPPGVHDVGVEIWGQPDAFSPWDPPQASDEAAYGRTHAELWAAAAESPLGGSRLLTGSTPASPPGIASLTVPLTTGGSVVLVVGAEPDRLEAIAASERVTGRFPAAGFSR